MRSRLLPVALFALAFPQAAFARGKFDKLAGGAASSTLARAGGKRRKLAASTALSRSPPATGSSHRARHD